MKKFINRILSTAVISCLAIGAMPVPVLAARDGHPQITSMIKLDNSLSGIVSCKTQNHHNGDPCWQYDYATQTLTLNGVDINIAGNGGIQFTDQANVTIVLQDGSVNNVISEWNAISNNMRSLLPSVTLLNLTFNGSGTLNVKTPATCIVSFGNVTINSGTFNLNSSDDSCLICDKDLTINGGVINATNASSTYSTITDVLGLTSPDNMYFNGGEITLKNTGGGKTTVSEPVLGAGMNYDSATGTWSNKAAPPAPDESAPAAPKAAEAPAAAPANITMGANKNFSRGRSASFNLEGHTPDFSGVWVDGSAIAASNYIISNKSTGSQTVELTPSFTKSLPLGVHGISFIYGGSGAYAEFVIDDNSTAPTTKPNPKTGVTAEMLG